MIGSNPTDATFLVGNDHPVLHGVKVVLLAQGSEQFNRRFIGSLCHGIFAVAVSEQVKVAPPVYLIQAGSHISTPMWVLLAAPPACQPRWFQGRV